MLSVKILIDKIKIIILLYYSVVTFIKKLLFLRKIALSGQESRRVYNPVVEFLATLTFTLSS